MPIYQHTQWGTVLLAIFGVLGGLVFFVARYPGVPQVLDVVLIVLVVVSALFANLTVTVSSGRLFVRFGVGLIRKSFRIGDIVRVEAVRNRWYYGWGVRYTPHGWLLNVSGLDAVEITLGNGRTYRIGTDEPEALLAAIRAVSDRSAV